MQRYGSAQVWLQFSSVYELLPLAAIVDGRFFCCHGGLSPEIKDVQTIKELQRTPNIPHDGGLCDLMWSDPIPEDAGSAAGKSLEAINEWEVSPRGAGYYFSSKVTAGFLHHNKLERLIRAHQLCAQVAAADQGHCFDHKDRCLTIFSAPNYCLRSGNRASFLEIGVDGAFDM